MTTVQSYPAINLPSLYINGFIVSNDATSPNTILDISAGQCRDSNDIIDIVLGSQNVQSQVTTAPLLLNSAINGVNGLDTGTIAASTLYSIYAIGDSTYNKPVASILSLSVVQPLMPYGYDSFRRIGAVRTDGSSHFLKFYTSTGSNRNIIYDAPLALTLPGTAPTTYTAVALTGFVPVLDNLTVFLIAGIVPNAAGNILSIQGGNSVGDQVVLTGQATTVNNTAGVSVLSQLVAGVSKINYKSTAGTDAISMKVSGFALNL